MDIASVMATQQAKEEPALVSTQYSIVAYM